MSIAAGMACLVSCGVGFFAGAAAAPLFVVSQPYGYFGVGLFVGLPIGGITAAVVGYLLILKIGLFVVPKTKPSQLERGALFAAVVIAVSAAFGLFFWLMPYR
jgi:hypothetical protein